MSHDALRIALVGLGPKGLYCLERLAVELRRVQPSERVEIRIFEPHTVPGAGPVYDPSQPPWLRMNFANRHINLWSAPPGALPGDRPDFVSWLRRRVSEEVDPAAYAPRGQVGEYLHGGYRKVLAVLEGMPGVEIEVVSNAVERIDRSDGYWRLRAGAQNYAADEVMLATGHDSRRPADRPEAADHPRVTGVFPVRQHLSPERVPPGATVAVRGFGLTALDAILTLTEGRGGSFEPSLQGAGESAQWTYHRGAQDVARILPFSRTGRPLLAKPDGLRPAPGLEAVWRQGRQRLQESDLAGHSAMAHLTAILAQTATRAVAVQRRESLDSTYREPPTPGAEDILQRVEDFADGAAGRIANRVANRTDDRAANRISETQPLEALERSLATARGACPPGPDWALGETWRRLYPALVEWVATGALDPHWDRFQNLARGMERLAFGPPAESVARLLALVRAGVVDLSWLSGTQVDVQDGGVQLRQGDRVEAVDILVNAVIAPPGLGGSAHPPEPASLYQGLQLAGWVRTLPHCAGAEVSRAGQAVGADGLTTPGLSLVGRPTEGRVLGNDTLNRSLHAIPERWARRVVEGLAANPSLDPTIHRLSSQSSTVAATAATAGKRSG